MGSPSLINSPPQGTPMWGRAASSTASSAAAPAGWGPRRESPSKPRPLPCGRSTTRLHPFIAEWLEEPHPLALWAGVNLVTPPGAWLKTPPPCRCLQAVQLDRHIQLLDCPGVVMATGTPQNTTITPLRGVLAPEKLQDPLGPAAAILRRCPPEQVGRPPPKFGSSGWGDRMCAPPALILGCHCPPQTAE